MTNWYDRVSKDITNVPAAIAHYRSELGAGKADVKISGSIERTAAAMPGIVETRFCQLQEVEAILEYLNICLKQMKSHHFRKYLETYQRVLSSRDCEKYVDGEQDIVDFEILINDVALLRNQYLGLIKGIDVKQWQISNIVKLRAAGLDDASI
jgi:hypothetical protein